MKKLLQQFMKFGVVGISAFVVEYVCLYVFTEFAFPAIFPHMTEDHCALFAAPVAFCISTIYNYIFSMKYVFEKRTDASGKKVFFIFIVLSLIALGLNQMLMTIFIKHFGIYYMISKVLATLIVTVYNFISRKAFIEEHTQGESSNSAA